MNTHIDIRASVVLILVPRKFLAVPSDDTFCILGIVSFDFTVLDHDYAHDEAHNENASRDTIIDAILSFTVRLHANVKDQESKDFTNDEAKLLKSLCPTMIALLDVIAQQGVLHDSLDKNT